MTASTTTSLITDSIADFGTAGLVILGGVVGIAVALLVFRFGWRKLRGAAH